MTMLLLSFVVVVVVLLCLSVGPFDHVDMEYDYHFTLCGSTPPTPFECMGNNDIFRAPVYQVRTSRAV